MIKVDSLSREEINLYSEEIAEAFISEPGSFAFMNIKDATKLFKMILVASLEANVVYTTSENKEGILICWNKKDKPKLKTMFKLLLKMIFTIPLKVNITLKKSQSDWMDIESKYKDKDDYLYVFLITVRKEYQHKGYFKQIMNFAKEKAQERNCIYFLDTDSEVKKDKYVHEGMHVVHEAKQKSGITMYLLEGNK